MNVVKYGKELPGESIDVHNRPQSPDLGPAHTSGTPETPMRGTVRVM
jgi:hypothetical protein